MSPIYNQNKVNVIPVFKKPGKYFESLYFPTDLAWPIDQSEVLNLAGKVLSVMSAVTLGSKPYVCVRHNSTLFDSNNAL